MVNFPIQLSKCNIMWHQLRDVLVVTLNTQWMGAELPPHLLPQILMLVLYT